MEQVVEQFHDAMRNACDEEVKEFCDHRINAYCGTIVCREFTRLVEDIELKGYIKGQHTGYIKGYNDAKNDFNVGEVKL